MAAAPGELTILVAARNAGSTIERAIRSCLPDRCRAIILADDRSTDDTVVRARTAGGRALLVVRSPSPGGVATARQQALDAVDTQYAAWLDADDEWIPGRAARLTALLEAGFDVATESIDLHDGPSGVWLRRLETPPCLRAQAGPLRLFERNLLPGDTQVAFRVETYRRAGGYDPTICGPESFDLLLRALRGGATIGIGSEVGYRMYAYPWSLSRNLGRQRASLAVALRKHEYEDVRRLYLDAGLRPRLAAWALVMMAQFRDEPAAALRYLDEACPEESDPLEILEPDGPWPFAEGWRCAFHRGTSLLSLGGHDDDAVVSLRRAESFAPTAEGANNLGVALARTGRRAAAAAAFADASARFEGYADATFNAQALAPDRITTHPLRRGPNRRDYPAGVPVEDARQALTGRAAGRTQVF
jgi:glycosyltransferase involved in cell wall biosynthesis